MSLTTYYRATFDLVQQDLVTATPPPPREPAALAPPVRLRTPHHRAVPPPLRITRLDLAGIRAHLAGA